MGAPLIPWYGLDAAWRVLLERDVRRAFGDALRHTLTRSELTYQLDDLDVPGDPQGRNIRITFHAQPPYPTYGQQPPGHSPRAYHPAGAVQAPLPRRRAVPLAPLRPAPAPLDQRQGLLVLIELIRRHLFLELWWRQTGTWVLEDAPHGFGKAR